jgi:hypothetical protein
VKPRQVSKSSSTMPSKRHSSASLDYLFDPSLIPLPPSPAPEQSVSDEESGTDFGTSSPSDQAPYRSVENALKSRDESGGKEPEYQISNKVDESVKAIAGIDKWNKAISVSILITFWEKLDVKKKQPLVSNDAEKVELGSDNPIQSTASHPRSRLSLDDITVEGNSIALKVQDVESGADKSDNRTDNANFHSFQVNELSSLSDKQPVEPENPQETEDGNHVSPESLPETLRSYFTTAEAKRQTWDVDVEEPIIEREMQTDAAPSFPPQEGVEVGIANLRFSSLIVEDQSMQNSDKLTTLASPFQPTPSGNGEREKNSLSQPEIQETHVVEDLETEETAEEDPAAMKLPTSESDSQDQTAEEVPTKAQHTDPEEPPATEQSEEPGYFNPCAPTLYVVNPPTYKASEAAGEADEKGNEKELLEDKPASIRSSPYTSHPEDVEIFELNDNSPRPSLITTAPPPEELSERAVEIAVDDETPEPESESLAEKALLLSTRKPKTPSSY